MRDKPNTRAPARASFALVKQPVPFDAFNCEAYKQWLQPIQVTDFYRSKPMDEQLQELQQAEQSSAEKRLAEIDMLVLEYDAAVRAWGTGPEVTAKYQALWSVLRKGVAS